MYIITKHADFTSHQDVAEEFSNKTVFTTLLMTVYNIIKTMATSYFRAKTLQVPLNEYFLHTLTGKSSFIPFVDALR